MSTNLYTAEFVPDERNDGYGVDLFHRNGVPWYDAPTPRRLHRCRPQTKGWLGLREIWRCACGSLTDDGRYWAERNRKENR